MLSGVLIMTLIISIFGNGLNANAENNLLSKEVLITDSALKGAFLVSEPKSNVILEKYANAHSLTDKQLVELLEAVGFTGRSLKTAWAVAKAESNGRPLAFNGNVDTGDSSYGIFQINMIGDLGPDRREKFNLNVNAELFNPVKNAEIAFHMTNGGANWKSWKYAKPKAYQKWLKKFPDNLS
jgi:hypothetical protein